MELSFVIGDRHKCDWQLEKNGNPRSSIDWRGARKRRIRHANRETLSQREWKISWQREIRVNLLKIVRKRILHALDRKKGRERAYRSSSNDRSWFRVRSFRSVVLSSFLDKAWLVCQGNDLQSLRLFLTISFLLFLSEDNSCLTTMNEKTLLFKEISSLLHKRHANNQLCLISIMLHNIILINRLMSHFMKKKN